MDLTAIVTQGVGLVAFALSLVSYQFKSQRTLFAIRVGSDLLWALHYALLMAPAAALTVLTASIRTALAVFWLERYKTYVIGVAIITVIIICAVFSEGKIIDYLPALTGVIYGAAVYFHGSYAISRLLMMAGLAVWLTIGIYYGSIAEILSSGFSICSIIVGFIRHGKVQKHLDFQE